MLIPQLPAGAVAVSGVCIACDTLWMGVLPDWPRATLVDLMKGHLSTTTAEVVARLNKNWDADVRAFDELYHHILMMSDALTDGIVKQFPNRFDAGPTATSGAK